MDGAAVRCRYFGLGDDRPYFHPSAAPAHPAVSPRRARVRGAFVRTYARTCVYLRKRIHGDISRAFANCPTGFTCEATTDFSNPPETR
jgi:hypothetical protein